MKLGSSEDFQHDTATNGGVNICEHLIAGKKRNRISRTGCPLFWSGNVEDMVLFKDKIGIPDGDGTVISLLFPAPFISFDAGEP
jgi:hypothetical protein